MLATENKRVEKKKGTLSDTNYSETSIKRTPSGPSQVSA